MAKFSFLTTQAWEPDIHHFGIAGILTDTILIALVAVVIAIPIALGLSLFITEVAPHRIKRTLVSLVDLMAAVPSVVYGLWALYFLQGRTIGVVPVAVDVVRVDPVLQGERLRPDQPDPSRPRVYTASTFVVGIAVSLMVIPILLLGHARVVLPGAARASGRAPTPSAPPGGG